MALERSSPTGDWSFLGERVLLVSIFPPAEDGIARYADQLAFALSADRKVARLGIPGGGGERVRRLKGGLNALRLVPSVRGFDDVVLMYHPHYYIGEGLVSALASYAAWIAVTVTARVTFVVHERDDYRPAELGRRGRTQFWLREHARSALWRRRIRAVFHTEWERREFAARFPGGRRIDVVVTHGSFFRPAATASRREARERLGLPAHRTLLLCIGFHSYENPDKGFDRAIRAAGEAHAEGAELHIVGAKIREGRDVDRHVEHLRRMAAETPGVHLHEGFVSDQDFDLWVQAADAVITPYRTASSSGVIARSHLLGTPVIASGAGGTREQLGPEDLCFSTEEELVAALRVVAARRRADERPRD